MSNVLMDISLQADTQHWAVLSVYMKNYQHLKTYYIWSNLSVKKLSAAIHNLMPEMEQHNWLCCSWFCTVCSDLLLGGKPWSATDNAAEATDDFLHFFFLIKNTV